VLEKGWIGSGNAGRNTTIIRSNYLLPGNIPFYEWSMKLWEGLEQDINYNAMVSQRGVLNLFHSDAQRDAAARRGNAMRLHGVDSELLDRDAVRAMVPYLDFDNARFPIQGGLLQRAAAPRGTTRSPGAMPARRPARRRHHPELRSHRHPHQENGAVAGWRRRAASSAPARSAWRSPAAFLARRRMAGLRLPIESHVLQAFVSEGHQAADRPVITFGAGHFYISQSDKGGLVFGGDIDGYNSYAAARQSADDRGCLRGRHGADADDRPRAHAAPLGRHHGHVDGRLPDHRPHAGRRPLSQCRLVLWRLQGDAGLRLVLRPSDRPRPAARGGEPPIGSTVSPPPCSPTT
jgi:heterotetrameric sarcosine oxidase beta subunit